MVDKETKQVGGRSQQSEQLPELSMTFSKEDVAEVVAIAGKLSAFMQTQRLASFQPLKCFSDVLKKNRNPSSLSSDNRRYLESPQKEGALATSAVTESLQRISSCNLGELAWVSVNEQEAQTQAGLLDEKPQSQRGLLYGYTIGLKDMFAQLGKVSAWGAKSAVLSQPASYDAAVVTQLKAADGVILGTQHMAEFALSPTGFNQWYSPGRSPFNPEYISGGSSSGAGMSVGAAHVTAAIGSDTGGSIRLPAACCGVVGLKPTQYVVSAEGAMPLSPSLDCLGPLARTVTECATVYAVLSAPLEKKSFTEPNAIMSGAQASEFTVALPELVVGDLLSAKMHEVMISVANTLSNLGVNIIKVPLPDLEQLGKLSSIILSVEANAYHRLRMQESPELYGRQVLRRLARGKLLSGADYYDALRLREPLLKKFLSENMQGAQALLLPTLPDLQPLISQTVNREQSILEKEFSRLSWWTRGINYLGVPALSLPVSLAESGLYFSTQLIGYPHGELDILGLGFLLESHLGELK